MLKGDFTEHRVDHLEDKAVVYQLAKHYPYYLHIDP
jgi:hypothetical protein